VNATLVTATFAREQDLLAATRAAREAGLRIVDAHTPYAVHGLDAAMGLRPSRLTWVCFLAGATGLALALLFQYWTSATDWPINVGGKPFDSLPAFIPVAFEVTVLFAGLGAVAALLLRCGLRPGRTAILPAPGVTDDRFALIVASHGAAHAPDEIEALLGHHRPVAIERSEP